MRPPQLLVLLIALLLTGTISLAQKRTTRVSPGSNYPAAQRSVESRNTAIVIDETLSVLRSAPSLFGDPIHRVRRGRKVQILGQADADGVKFLKVSIPPSDTGWVQADAVFGKFRPGDEERLARLVEASDGFDQIEIASEFFNLYTDSKFRPSILLLFGDLLEEVAVKLTKDANSKLRRSEMAATGAPLHSYFLNYASLDRYRKLGIVFQFNALSRAFHYNGDSWKEIVSKYSKSPESVEAQKRLDTLKIKMAPPAAQ
jgi:Bacterial SH3 domain